MRRRGFTLVELATVLTILSVLLPSIFLMQRTLLADHARALADLHAAEAMRGFSEELRHDLESATVAPGDALVLAGGRCGKVEYQRRDDATVWRVPGAACGETPHAIAAHVASLVRTGSIVEITFEEEAGKGLPERTLFRLGLPEAR